VRTVLIVDDSDAFRAAARALLEAQAWVIVGEAPDGASGLAASSELAPDVVLLDVGLPDVDGFEVAEALADTADPPRVVMCSTHSRMTFEQRLAHGRVAGFLSKSELSGPALTRIVTSA
jgi:DNA-binding NarL/FixJ family response regulator